MRNTLIFPGLVLQRYVTLMCYKTFSSVGVYLCRYSFKIVIKKILIYQNLGNIHSFICIYMHIEVSSATVTADETIICIISAAFQHFIILFTLKITWLTFLLVTICYLSRIWVIRLITSYFFTYSRHKYTLKNNMQLIAIDVSVLSNLLHASQ